MAENSAKGWTGVAVLLANCVGVLSMAIGGYLINRIDKLTDSQARLDMQLATLRADLMALPSQLPPKWFVQRVDKLDNSVSANNAALGRIEKRISIIENKVK